MPTTLYYRESGGNVVVVSEPLDTERAHWKPVPPGHAIVAKAGKPVASSRSSPLSGSPPNEPRPDHGEEVSLAVLAACRHEC